MPHFSCSLRLPAHHGRKAPLGWNQCLPYGFSLRVKEDERMKGILLWLIGIPIPIIIILYLLF
jgi:hypothetical protein